MDGITALITVDYTLAFYIIQLHYMKCGSCRDRQAKHTCGRRIPMLDVDLTYEEKAMLADILGNTLSDLRMEIADTDRLDYRNMLKKQKDVIQKVIDAVLLSAR